MYSNNRVKLISCKKTETVNQFETIMYLKYFSFEVHFVRYSIYINNHIYVIRF